MTIDRVSFYASFSAATVAVLSFAAALINAGGGYVVAASFSAVTVLVSVWALLLAQRWVWRKRTAELMTISKRSHACAEQCLSAALHVNARFDEIQADIQRMLDRTGAPKEVIHDHDRH